MYLLIFDISVTGHKEVCSTFCEDWLEAVDCGDLTVIKFENGRFSELHSNDSNPEASHRGEWKPIGE